MVFQRTAITGSTLVRLLARLTQVDATDSPEVFTERLGQWIGWAEAIPLSAALSASARAVPLDAGVWLPDAAHAERVRTQLEQEISDEGQPPPRRTREPVMRGVPLPPPAPDFGTWRRRYQTRQQSFDNAIAPLRAQLRMALAGTSAEMARLSAVDAVMERVMAPQERQWLAGIPGLLEPHYERLRRTAEASAQAQAGAPFAPLAPVLTARPSATEEPQWVKRFGQDLQHLLRAELEFRWQPIEGLLAALRTTTQTEHA